MVVMSPNMGTFQRLEFLLPALAGCINRHDFLILDRDTKYCEAFRYLLRTAGPEPVRLPPRSPDMNAYNGTVREIDQARVYGSADSLR